MQLKKFLKFFCKLKIIIRECFQSHYYIGQHDKKNSLEITKGAKYFDSEMYHIVNKKTSWIRSNYKKP